MANIIDWYLIEFDRLLKRRVPAEQREAMVAEIEDHIRIGSEAETSELVIERLGTPRQLALVMLKTNPGSEPRWTRVLAAICLFLIPLVFWVALLNSNTGSLLALFAILWVLISIAAVCIVSFRGIRPSGGSHRPGVRAHCLRSWLWVNML